MTTYLNKKWTVLLLIIGSLTLTGCKKYLDLEPKNSTYDQVFWVNGSNVQKALSGSYSMLRSAFQQDRSYFVFGDIAADNFALGGDFWNYTSFIQNGNFNFGYAPYLEPSLWNWSRFYSVINQCHLIIENTPKIPSDKFSGGEAQQRQLEGEARFLRAYVYFYMQRVWGNVILTTESLKDPQDVPSLPRATEDEIFSFIVADLEKSVELLGTTGNKAVANKGAGQALLAHVHAWNHDYEQAERLATDLINSSQYELEAIDDYTNIWKGSSRESIFELNMLFDAVSNEATAGFFNVFLTEPFIRNKGLNSTWSLSDFVTDELFNQDEARFDAVVETGSGGTRYILTKYSGVDYYDANNPDTYVVSNNLVLLRLADIILLRAEARFKNGNAVGALEDLNLIKERAGLEPFTEQGAALFDEIFDERRRELIGEGHAKFDMIRMEQLQRLFPDAYSQARIAAKGYHWPLDMRQLLPQAPLLTQNEWWKSH